MNQLLTDNEQRATIECMGMRPSMVALSLKARPDLRPQVVATQVDCRQRMAKKVPSWAAVQSLFYPAVVNTEQCSSEELAVWHASLMEGVSALDLTGGIGADTYFFAQKMKQVVYVEQSAELCQAVSHNYAALNVSNVKICNDTAESFLSSNPSADNIFIDPSRRASNGKRVYCIADCTPDVCWLASEMLRVAPNVLIKLSSMLDIDDICRSLPCVSDIYIAGSRVECKDIVVRLRRDFQALEPQIHAVYITSVGSWSELTFSKSQELNALPMSSATPVVGHVLYEPSAVLMKAGPYRLISQKYGIAPIAANTHLFTSPTDIEGFMGKKFLIRATYEFGKRGIKSLMQNVKNASVVVRNFTLSAEVLRKRLKVGESDSDYIFGVSTSDKKYMLIWAKRIG